MPPIHLPCLIAEASAPLPFPLPQGQVGTRTASSVAVSYVELYSLSRSTFDRVAAHYPEVLELFRFIAEARQAINENRWAGAPGHPPEHCLHAPGSRCSKGSITVTCDTAAL